MYIHMSIWPCPRQTAAAPEVMGERSSKLCEANSIRRLACVTCRVGSGTARGPGRRRRDFPEHGGASGEKMHPGRGNPCERGLSSARIRQRPRRIQSRGIDAAHDRPPPCASGKGARHLLSSPGPFCPADPRQQSEHGPPHGIQLWRESIHGWENHSGTAKGILSASALFRNGRTRSAKAQLIQNRRAVRMDVHPFKCRDRLQNAASTLQWYAHSGYVQDWEDYVEPPMLEAWTERVGIGEEETGLGRMRHRGLTP